MAATGFYSLTLAAGGSLLVNDSPVVVPDSVNVADGDAVLAWAFERMNVMHESVGGTLVLTVSDDREGGYGAFQTALEEGVRISVDDVHAMAGEAKGKVAPDDLHPSSASSPTYQPLHPRTLDTPTDEPPVEPPAAFTPSPHEVAAKNHEQHRMTRAMLKEKAAREKRAARKQALLDKERRKRLAAQAAAESKVRQAEIEQTARKHGMLTSAKSVLGNVKKNKPTETEPAAAPVTEKTRKTRKNKEAQFMDSLKSRNAAAAEKFATQSAWTPTERIIPRPTVEADEVQHRKNRPFLVGAVVAVPVLLVGAVAVVQAQTPLHVAVCVDERSMTRLADANVCSDADAAIYNRWVFIPEGSTVPPVGGSTAGVGTFESPPASGSRVVYSFDVAGGVVE